MFKTCAKLVWQAGLIVGFVLATVVNAGVATSSSTEGLPDLAILHLSRTPRTRLMEARDPRDRPRELTWTARVANVGEGQSGSFNYVWYVNGKRVKQGTHATLDGPCLADADGPAMQVGGRALRTAALRARTYADLTLTVRRRRRAPYVVRIQIEPARSGASEASFANNAREVRSDSLAYLVVVPRGTHNQWLARPRRAGERALPDWLQWHLDLLHANLARSSYEAERDGVRLRLRIDQMLMVADGQPAPSVEDARAGGWDGVWALDAVETAASPADKPAASFLPAVHPQLGLALLSALPATQNRARDPETGEPLTVGYRPRQDLPTSLLGEPVYPAYAALWLNHLADLVAGERARSRIRQPFLALPRAVRVTVLDNNGHPVAGAKVALFQRGSEGVPAQPLARGVTDGAGRWTLPNRPGKLWANPFGQIGEDGDNALLMLWVRGRGQTDVVWLPITRFTGAYWRGERGLATLPVATRLPGAKAPPSPRSVRVALTGGGAALEWAPMTVRGLVGYRIYRADPPFFEYRPIGVVSSEKTSFLDETAPATAAHYAVTALDRDGSESAFGSALPR